MTWYWYIARPNEIFLDLDSPIAATYAVMRLRRAIRRKALQVQEVYFFRSYSRRKYHLILFLKESLPSEARALWALWLGSDKVRGIYTLERLRRGIGAADLLIVQNPYSLNGRVPDSACECPGKHKPRRITNHCPVLRELHGNQAGAEYFPRNNDVTKRQRGPVLPIGRVPLSRIVRT